MSVRNILRAASGGFAFFSFLYAVYRNLYNRQSKVPKLGERVLVLGASSGIGRSIARQYAERGARVCIVGRREALVNEVVTECRNVCNSKGQEDIIFGVAADFANVDDMVRTRTLVEAGKVQTFSLESIFQNSLKLFRMERSRYTCRCCWSIRFTASHGDCWSQHRG